MNRYWVVGTFVCLLVALTMCLGPATVYCPSTAACVAPGSVPRVPFAAGLLAAGVGLWFVMAVMRDRSWTRGLPASNTVLRYVRWSFPGTANSLRLSTRVFLL